MSNESTNAKMNAKDAIFASLADCYVTTDNKRYNFMQAINLEARVTKTKVEVPILGQTGKGHKATGWNGEGNATFHFNTSIFSEIMEKYKQSGQDLYFDIQVTTNDPTSEVGPQTVILRYCNLDNVVLTKFDASADYLDANLDFTFDDWAIVTPFGELSGM